MGEGLSVSVAQEFCCSGRRPADGPPVSDAARERKLVTIKQQLHSLNERLGPLVEEEITSLIVCDDTSDELTYDEAKRLLRNLQKYDFVVNFEITDFDRNGNGSIEKEEFEAALRKSVFQRPKNLELLVQSSDDIEEHLRELFTEDIKESRAELPPRSVTVPALPLNNSSNRVSTRRKLVDGVQSKRRYSAPDLSGPPAISVPDVARLMRELLVELGHTDTVIQLQSDNGTAGMDLTGQLGSFDTDGDGQLTFAEFFQAYSQFLVRIYYLKKSSLLKSPRSDKHQDSARCLDTSRTESF